MSNSMQQAFKALSKKTNIRVQTSNPKTSILKSLFYPRISSTKSVTGVSTYYNICEQDFTLSECIDLSITHFRYNGRFYCVLSCGLDGIITCLNIVTLDRTIFVLNKKVTPLFILPTQQVFNQSSFNF